ncbi:cytosolic sulfotransferase 8 [Elaeis guineensis]|uniref:cytosolic sulfotransferase 8 n=1 Tax=Elaeis guineensis var. tenera TaxID=51953 RepID=UPI00057B415D
MATLPSLSSLDDSIQPDSKRKQEGEEQTPKQSGEFDDLISTLPLDEGLVPIRLRQYQGVWIPEYFLGGIIAVRQRFTARPDDLLLVSYPKSGTTWLKALAFAIMTRIQHPLAHHPLLSLNPHQCVEYLDSLFFDGQQSMVEALPSPRIFSSHTTYSLLSDSIKGSGCRIIYICRDPKDVIVSRWHFNAKMSSKAAKEPIPLTKTFEMFCEGVCPFGLIWDHALGYWKESLRRPDKVLFLKYEELMEEPVAKVKRMAEFMGCPFSPDEEKEGMVEEVIRLCSFEKLSNLEINTTGVMNSIVPTAPPTFAFFFRKGKVGDWKSHLSPEMAQRLDEITQEKLEGSGLTLGRTCLKAAAKEENPVHQV